MDEKYQKIKSEIDRLKDEINYHRRQYHIYDREKISQEVLDSLKKRLKELEEQYPEFRTPDSPTIRVEGKVLEKFQKVTHSYPMLSLEDVFTENDFTKWEERNSNYLQKSPFRSRILGTIEYFLELKIDGLAVSIIYKDGLFHRAATRGDGRVGENVTENVKTIESVPLSLSVNNLKDSQMKKLKNLLMHGDFEIRGEIYIDKRDFQKLNEKREKNGEEKFANPRNLSAGSIRQLDPKLAASRPLKFIPYSIATDLGLSKHSEEHALLKTLGFRFDRYAKVVQSDEIFRIFQKIEKDRSTLLFQIDGVVVTIDDRGIFQSLGTVGKTHRGTVALKFSPAEAATVVKKIRTYVGRQGTLTPVAELNPVEIAGTIVRHASLHNFDEIERLDVREGDTVIIYKAGDIIPKIRSVLRHLRPKHTKKFHKPKVCPHCKGKVAKRIDQLTNASVISQQKKQSKVNYYCVNTSCYAQTLRKIIFFASKAGIDIDGLGKNIIRLLYDKKILTDAGDIFSLTEKSFANLEGFKEKKIRNLLRAVNERRKISLKRFIIALGIEGLGAGTVDLLGDLFSKKFTKKSYSVKSAVEVLKSITKEELFKVQGIGESVSGSFIHFFHSDRKKDPLLEKFEQAKIILMNDFQQTLGEQNLPLSGKSLLVTGVLPGISRKKFAEIIRSNGGKFLVSFSKQLDFLIIGENPGSKLAKAKDAKIPTMTLDEFYRTYHLKK